MNLNSFGSQSRLTVLGQTFGIHRLDALYPAYPAVASLPFSIKILLENLLRTEDGRSVRTEDIEAVARWQAQAAPTGRPHGSDRHSGPY